MEIKGYTYGFFGKRGEYRSEEGIASQDALYDIGVNWMCLAVVMMQKTCMSTEMHFSFRDSASDRDLIAAIDRAHKKNVKVCLKPMVNSEDHIWRARISFPDGEDDSDPYWDEWFKNYTDFMTYYAELAEETGCEMLCIGCEMCGTEYKEKHWRKLIAEVRKVFSGKVMYNTNHGNELSAKWYDDLDYIGTSAYFPVGVKTPDNIEEVERKAAEVDAGLADPSEMPELIPCSDYDVMVKNWKHIADEIQKVYDRWKKPILFAEIGCRSAKTCASMPWDFKHTDLPHDEQEQANFYSSCLEVFAEKPWFAGAFWWDWSTTIYHTREEAAKDNGFNIHLKLAETALKEAYARL